LYNIKEAFYTLQGEGAQQGRAAVFCRFSKCNLWTGRERDRSTAVCTFCDTDFVGTDGQNGGSFTTAIALATHLDSLWPAGQLNKFVVCTGGEPLLQLDNELIAALHGQHFIIAVETNGTLPAPASIDWLCVSPKSNASVVITACDELKLVYPQADALPDRFTNIKASYYFLSPLADPLHRSGIDTCKESNTQKALQYCMQHPKWRLSIQLHKILGID
jgi:7-carboxy-7-deazaguanine synthase